MKQLDHNEIEKVSGGDYHLRMTANVEAGAVWAVTSLFFAMMTGQITNADQFATQFNNAIANGADFNQVRLESITFSNFN